MLSINTAAHMAGALLLSAVAGVAIGNDTVGGMQASPQGGSSVAGKVACLDCSDRTRGYEWASSEKISSLDACGNAPWEFRQGCGDYLADRRGT